MDKKLYVAYGSNLHIEQMAYRCPDAVKVCNGVIKDYALVFRGSRSGAYATIIPEKGEEVPVVVWEISTNDEQRLDLYEGYPTFYYKRDFTITRSDTEDEITAMGYVMPASAKIGKPTKAYVAICDQGYYDQGLDSNKLAEAVSRNSYELFQCTLKSS